MEEAYRNDAVGEGRTASGEGGKESLRQHFIVKKCHLCVQYKAKNNACFGKGHPQMIRTVRVPEEGQRGMVDTRGVAPLHAHFYFRLKPGSPIFIWEDGKIVTLSPDDASKAVTVALAPGTVLERSLCHRQAITWLHKSNEPLVEYIVPEMSKPRLLPKGEVRIGQVEDFEGGVEGEARTESVDEESEYEVTAKREYEEPKRKRSRRRSIKLRDSSGSPSAGNDVKAASSGVSGGQTNPGEDRGGSEAAADEPPDISSLPTKEEVQTCLAEKLKACDEREVHLKAVIAKANVELEKNSECRKAAVASSNAQVLAIINRREAYAAHCEKLAARARAQNLADRESLGNNLSAHGSTAPDSRQQTAVRGGKRAPESDTSTDVPKYAEVTHHAAATPMTGPGTIPSAPSQGGVQCITGGSIPASQASPLTSATLSPQAKMPEPVVNRATPGKEGHVNTLAEPPAMATPEAQPLAPQADCMGGMQTDLAASCKVPSSSTAGYRSSGSFNMGTDPGPAGDSKVDPRVTHATAMATESTAAKATSSSTGVGFSSWIPARSGAPDQANGHDAQSAIGTTSGASELPKTPVQPANESAKPNDAPSQGATSCPVRQNTGSESAAALTAMVKNENNVGDRLPREHHPAGWQETAAKTASGTSEPVERSPPTASTLLRTKEAPSMSLSEAVTLPPPGAPALGISQSGQEAMQVDVDE